MSQAAQLPDINPRTLLDCRDPRYQHPGHEDVMYLKDSSGLTYRQLGEAVNYRGRQVQAWTARPGSAKSAEIPYAAWRLLLVELGIV